MVLNSKYQCFTCRHLGEKMHFASDLKSKVNLKIDYTILKEYKEYKQSHTFYWRLQDSHDIYQAEVRKKLWYLRCNYVQCMLCLCTVPVLLLRPRCQGPAAQPPAAKATNLYKYS